MADEAPEENVIEEWTEPVDLSALGDDGPTTIFVGGFSSLRTIQEGLEAVQYRDDRLVILPGEYREDVSLNTTKFTGVRISGLPTTAPTPPPAAEAPSVSLQGAAPLVVYNGAPQAVIDGKLTLTYTPVDPATALKAPAEPEGEEGDLAATTKEDEEGGAAAAADEGDGEEDGKKDAGPQRLPGLTLAHLSFRKGIVVEGLAGGYVDDCVFGLPVGMPCQDHGAMLHAFSKTLFSRCQLYGSGKSVVYGFPKSSCVFDKCLVAGTEPQPVVQEAARRRPRGYQPPPPPPPAAPTDAICATALYADDASLTLTDSVLRNTTIGVVVRDTSADLKFQGCHVGGIVTVGIQLLAGASPKIHRVSASLCGREALLIGTGAHPTVRNCTFAGDVRCQRGSVLTGVTDVVIGLNKEFLLDDPTAVAKGCKIVKKDPTVVPLAKKEVEEE